MESRRRKSLGAWLLAAFVCALVGACVFTPEAERGPCQSDTDCTEDGNPCTKGTCDKVTGFCDNKPQALPFGDIRCDDDNPCTVESCAAGACVHTATDAPPDDGNECTTDVCSNGVASHTALADGTACGAGGVLECTAGKCNCMKSSECGTSTACLKIECTDNQCTSKSLAAGTFIDGKDPGDCLHNVCDGMNNVVAAPDPMDAPADTVMGNCQKTGCDDQGNVISVDDPTDKPADDQNECTTEGCNGGTPVNHENVADGTSCGMGPTCGPVAGGKYEAVGHQICQAGTCTTPAGTSCDLAKCDPNDATVCAKTCADAGQCIAGTYCDGATNTCQLAAGAGQPCANQAQCGMNLTCVDGVCCSTPCNSLCEQCDNTGLCTQITNGMDPANECMGTDACNGSGACGKTQGSPCGADAECLTGFCADGICCNSACGGACNRCDITGSQGTCKAVDINLQVTGCAGNQACDGAGNCKSTNGQACGAVTDCISGQCQDGFCCNSSCSGACARCDVAGMVGTCTNVTAGQQVGSCNGTNACDGMNNCKAVNGQGCGANSDCVSGQCQDNFCCNNSCTGACNRCDIPGSVGTCMNVAAGQQVMGCSGNQACDGANTCKKSNGQACGNNGECATGFCADGFCCNNACNQLCKACSGAKTGGANGSCNFIPAGQDPDNECSNPGGNNCDGAGACQ